MGRYLTRPAAVNEIGLVSVSLLTHSLTNNLLITSTTILNNLLVHIFLSLYPTITHCLTAHCPTTSLTHSLTHSTMYDSPSYSPPFTHSDTHSLPDLPMDVLLYTLQFQWPLLGCTLLEDMSEAARRSCVCV